MKLLVKISKYGLYSLVLAVVSAAVLFTALYLQGTAVDITRPERVIEAEGAGRDLSNLAETAGEKRAGVMASVSEQAGSEREKNFDLIGLESGLERLLQRRYDLKRASSEEVIAREEMLFQRRFEEFRAGQLEEAEELISESEAALEREIMEIDSEISERELQILQEVRRDYRQENWPELLNLRVKLRTMDLSADRYQEISGRVAEIEADIENRIERVKQQLESRLEQERLREVGQLRQRHNLYVQNVMSGLEESLESYRKEGEEEIAELQAEERERLETAREQLEERLNLQLEAMKGNLHSLYEN